MILYILWESWSVASRSYTLWARREDLPLSIGGQKPLTITEREREYSSSPQRRINNFHSPNLAFQNSGNWRKLAEIGLSDEISYESRVEALTVIKAVGRQLDSDSFRESSTLTVSPQDPLLHKYPNLVR